MKQKLNFMVIALAVMIIVNFLAVGLPLNGLSTKEISDSFQVFFVPAGYVFLIWNVIYLTQIWMMYVFYKKTDLDKNDSKSALNKYIDKTWIWYIINTLANVIWLFMWHYQVFILTVPVMLVLLISLIFIYRIYFSSKLNFKAVIIPMSIYLGWISVATIANLTAVLWWLGWDGFGIQGQVWAGVLIFVACILAVLMMLRHRDFSYPAVIIWAIIGIAVKFPSEAIITGTVVAGILIIAGVFLYLKITKTVIAK